MEAIKRQVEKLVKQHGGLNAAARAIGVDAPYLSRLRYGQKVNPSDATLRRLGLQRRVTFSERARI